MANFNVYTGADGSITLASIAGVEGEKAQAVLSENELVTVGRVQNVSVKVHSDIKPFHEIGQRYATELRPGNITIQGHIGRAYINGALLKLLLGEAATNRPAQSWVQPAFNMTLMITNPATPNVSSTITLHEVKLTDWFYTMPEDDFVIEGADFQALYLTVVDKT
jgi:hypothetical protein